MWRKGEKIILITEYANQQLLYCFANILQGNLLYKNGWEPFGSGLEHQEPLHVEYAVFFKPHFF